MRAVFAARLAERRLCTYVACGDGRACRGFSTGLDDTAAALQLVNVQLASMFASAG